LFIDLDQMGGVIFPLSYLLMSYGLPKHIVNLLILLGCFLLLAYAAKVYLTDPSYYKYGYYRADAVTEIASGTPIYTGAEACQECHANRKADWSLGTHKVVECEICHGTDEQHPGGDGIHIPADSIKLCTTCHEKMPARPDTQPQIVVGEHPFPHTDPLRCRTCHNPHSPRIGGPVATAEPADAETEAESPAPDMPASAAQCTACHGDKGEGKGVIAPLAGLESTYFVDQMNGYKSGTLQNPMMGMIAKGLSDEEIVELADYYAGLEANP
jgi:cytochrome c553